MARVDLTVRELLDANELDLGTGPWFQVDQHRIDLFADATEDHQWIHVDPERAAEGPFGTTIAHGYLTLSLLPRMLEDLFEITDQERGTNYGINRLRFTGVAPSGSRIRTTAQLGETKQRPDGGVQFCVEFEIEVEDQDRPAAVGEVVYLSYGPDEPE